MMSETTESVSVEALTELEAGEELTFQMEADSNGEVRELTGTVADHPYMDAHDDWMVVLTDVTRGQGPGAIRVAAGSPGSDSGHVMIYADGSVESRPSASRQIDIGTIRAVVTEVTTPEPEVRADGGADIADADGEFPTTALDYRNADGIPHGAAANSYQKRLVGNVFAGQVLVDLNSHVFDKDKTNYEAYTGHTWTIASVSDDSRWLTLRKRDGEDAGTERRLTVAAFARETILSERWTFLKDTRLANTWNAMGGDSSTTCKNCGVNTDAALSREKHFETTAGGQKWDATLRRCVGCGNYGVSALASTFNQVGQNSFTTGVISGPDAPWNQG